jgi:hypothetical protein
MSVLVSSLKGLGLAAAVVRTVLIQGPQSNVQMPTALAANWRQVAQLPYPVQGLAAVRLPDSSIVALGGNAAIASQTRLAARLVLGISSWSRLPDSPIALDTPAALALTPHAVMVVAPSFANGSIAQPSQALMLDPLHRTWTVLPHAPIPLLAPRLLRLDAHSVLAMGGVGNRVGAVFNLTSQRWTVLDSPWPNIASYSVVAVPGRGVLLLAGVAINAKQQPYGVRRAWLLSSSGEWRQVARPPFVVDGTQAIMIDAHHALFAGGYPIADNPRAATPPPLLYNVDSDTWSATASIGPNHRGAQVLSLGPGRAILVGGHAPGGVPSSGCLLFDGHVWTATEPIPDAWAGYAAVAVNNSQILLIGGDKTADHSIVPVADTMLLSL